MADAFALKIAYAGLEFFGSQVQKKERTVAGEMTKALEKGNFLESGKLKFAGRTDRYVSARENVAVYEGKQPILEKLNCLLPSDLVAWGWAAAPANFNPRFTVQRAYRYVLRKDGLEPEKLDGAALLVSGTHSFHNFCSGDKNPLITIDEVAVVDAGDFVFLDFKAQFFLRSMVRRLVTAIRRVAEGQWNTAFLSDLFEPTVVAPVEPAPAENLCLMEADYTSGVLGRPAWKIKFKEEKKRLKKLEIAGKFRWKI